MEFLTGAPYFLLLWAGLANVIAFNNSDIDSKQENPPYLSLKNTSTTAIPENLREDKKFSPATVTKLKYEWKAHGPGMGTWKEISLTGSDERQARSFTGQQVSISSLNCKSTPWLLGLIIVMHIFRIDWIHHKTNFPFINFLA